MKLTRTPTPGNLFKATNKNKAAHRKGRPLAITPAPAGFKIRKIMVPIDYSELSRQALRYARPFAEHFGATLTLVHVMEPMVYPAEFAYAPLGILEAEEPRLDELRARLKQMSVELGTSVPITSTVRIGRAWKEIVDLAKSQHIDLIILASHGYTGLKHALLGSVAEKVLRHAPCPALVIRAGEHKFP